MEITYPVIDFNPIFLSLGPLDIHWYGVTYLIGFGFYFLLGKYRLKHHPSSWNNDQLSDFLFYGALGVIIGGRLGWLLFYNDTSILDDYSLPFRIWEGGMSFHGGLAGVLLAMLYFKNKTNKTFFQVSDFIAPLIPTGILSVRLGNFINGELWGRLTDKPWAMIFPDSLPIHLHPSNMSTTAWQQMYQEGQLNAFARHPSALYEAIGEGLITFFVVWLVANRAKRQGTVSAVFLLSYGIARFVVEFFREPDANRGFIAFDWMTMGHLLTLPLLLAGLLILLSKRPMKK
ncbi:prolipoprotein diacylglyceryl transferase [Marinicella sp. S1101]|uniref:prolipoprotein diacylglyceryl transferase n=1 Tax=Marinicella marina TaxID=2996016 RepID=UPI00226089E9|nr:prolipoprotein diacylglyceryl transferase [Marinicella marina]MCX7554789.1 prolipoprotein diacylglyceryl transferase [Marinicella marina]MDJ1140978.1 prolipoprotein diacylglyceryl transferase [Marinicella marina]